MGKTLGQLFLTAARRISQAQTWLLLSLVYLCGVAPVALLYKLWADPLRLRRSSSSLWHRRTQMGDPMPWAKSQF